MEGLMRSATSEDGDDMCVELRLREVTEDHVSG